jgi:hypothetical protein
MLDSHIQDEALQQAVESYCAALHFARGAVLDDLCHANFLMQWAGAGVQSIDKAAFVARVGGRAAQPGVPAYEVLAADVDHDMAQVKLNVTVGARVYTDQLGFLRVGAKWSLVTKLFRVASGPALEV